MRIVLSFVYALSIGACSLTETNTLGQSSSFALISDDDKQKLNDLFHTLHTRSDVCAWLGEPHDVDGELYSKKSRSYYYQLAYGVYPVGRAHPDHLKQKHILDIGTGFGLFALQAVVDFEIPIQGMDDHLDDDMKNITNPLNSNEKLFYKANIRERSTFKELCEHGQCFDLATAGYTVFSYQIARARREYYKTYLNTKVPWNDDILDEPERRQAVLNEVRSQSEKFLSLERISWLETALKNTQFLLHPQSEFWIGGLLSYEDLELFLIVANHYGFVEVARGNMVEATQELLKRIEDEDPTTLELAQKMQTYMTKYKSFLPAVHDLPYNATLVQRLTAIHAQAEKIQRIHSMIDHYLVVQSK